MFERKIHYEWINGFRSLCKYPIESTHLTLNKKKVTCGNCIRILKNRNLNKKRVGDKINGMGR